MDFFELVDVNYIKYFITQETDNSCVNVVFSCKYICPLCSIISKLVTQAYHEAVPAVKGIFFIFV